MWAQRGRVKGDAMQKKFSFNDRELASLPPEPKHYRVSDLKTPCLTLRVYPSGVKTFYLRQRINGRQVEEKLVAFQATRNGPIVCSTAVARRMATEELTRRGVFGAVNQDRKKWRVRLGDVLDDYYEVNPTNLNAPTVSDRKGAYKNWLKAHLGKQWLYEITPGDIDRVIATAASSGLSARTIRGFRTIINDAFRWAAKQRLLPANHRWPTKEAAWPGKPKPRRRTLKRGEYRAFLDACEALATPSGARHDRNSTHPRTVADSILVRLWTYRRTKEVNHMRWEDIDWEAKVWRIVEEEGAATTKNGEDEVVGLDEMTLEILRRRRETADSPWVFPSRADPDKPLGDTRKSFDKVCRMAGITGLVPHDLRRSGGSVLAKLGENQKMIARNLGHKDVRSADVYTWEEDPQQLAEARNRANRAVLAEAGLAAPGEEISLNEKEWAEIITALGDSPTAAKVRLILDKKRAFS